MNISRQHTILVTGAGGAAIPALIESLRKNGYRVLAADMDPMAVGLYYADRGYVIPAGTSPDFIPALRDICRKESVTAIVPLVDEELVSALELERDGLIVLLPRQEFVALCLDKYVLMQRLKESGITIPETRLASEGSDGMSFPLIVKPRRGRGSRGLKIVGSDQALRSHIESCPYSPDELLLQEYIDGPEYTISAVVWRDGEVQAVVPKEIISKRGITRMAVTRRNPAIESLCFSVQESLKADGPFNVQLRYDSKGRGPLIFEINPRFSTSISLTMAAGIDELGGLLSQAIFGRKSFMFGAWREGIVMIRKSLDEFMDEKDFNNLRRKIAD
ncbi:MAG: ATP-grasp domain-containing protein [Nitrospiraceae bacterium]|nr:MAG: ATP-grasp domain-containing protein [Nitrospiraceae bacterium]